MPRLIQQTTVALGICVTNLILLVDLSVGQGTHCDPKKVITSQGCIRCHAQADAVWRKTPHYATFDTLHRRPEAKQIAQKMGLTSIKRGDLCIQCHYTQVEKPDGRVKPVSGISCESCHGAAKDWVAVHNDYGGLGATKQAESIEHANWRSHKSRELGMRNPSNLYEIAQSCLGCHTVPNEKLINVGGHSLGSLDFSLVAWSQGSLRHNFLRTSGRANAASNRNRLRVMHVTGMIADLEFSTRAVAKATSRDTYGITVAKRAAKQAVELYELQKSLNNPHVEAALRAFSKAELRTNHAQELTEIANKIASAGRSFAEKEDGSSLSAVDKLLPSPSTYK